MVILKLVVSPAIFFGETRRQAALASACPLSAPSPRLPTSSGNVAEPPAAMYPASSRNGRTKSRGGMAPLGRLPLVELLVAPVAFPFIRLAGAPVGWRGCFGRVSGIGVGMGRRPLD